MDHCSNNGLGIRVDVAGVAIVDAPDAEGRYLINLTMCNGHVLPHPILQRNKMNVLFYDVQCLKHVLSSIGFAMNARMIADNVTSFECESCLHIALPSKEESLRIASNLGVYSELVETRSINAAIAAFFKERLPMLKMCGPSMAVLHKTAFVFSTGIPMKNERTLDIRRCYTNALLQDRGCWLHFGVLDDITTTSSTEFMKLPGRYWVATENYFPLKGDGWYYSTVLAYAHEKGILFEARYKQPASVLLPSFLFRSSVEECKQRLTDADAKLVVNRFIGMLKTKTSSGRSSSSQRAFVTSLKHEADALLASDHGSYRTVEDGVYYCRRQSAVAASESSRHMYDQVIERAWIMVYDLWLYMQSKGGKLVCVKTDSVTASFDSPSDLDIGCTLREEEPPALPPMISFNETVLEPTIPTPPDPIEVGSSHRFTPPTSGMCILGRAGTGKSHALHELLQHMPTTRVISPTNRAASSFGDNGETIHSFFNIHDIHTSHVAHRQLQRIANAHRFLMVDEVFMCAQWMVQALFQLHLLGVTLILAGDPYQLPSVNGRQLVPEHHVLHVMCPDMYRMTDNVCM